MAFPFVALILTYTQLAYLAIYTDTNYACVQCMHVFRQLRRGFCTIVLHLSPQHSKLNAHNSYEKHSRLVDNTNAHVIQLTMLQQDKFNHVCLLKVISNACLLFTTLPLASLRAGFKMPSKKKSRRSYQHDMPQSKSIIKRPFKK